MTQADGSSATIKSNENIGLPVAAATGGWRESILVLVMVLAPIGLAVIVMAIGVAAIAQPGKCCTGYRRTTNTSELSALWAVVLRCRQLDRRGGRLALVVAPGAAAGTCLSFED